MATEASAPSASSTIDSYVQEMAPDAVTAAERTYVEEESDYILFAGT